jgi:hypothetical protein
MAVREVAFELECFEWADDRLEVAGRWKGLGRRGLARPVLTVDTEAGRRKRLVALPGGQFGTAAESWRAAFDWPGDPAEITRAELEVGGNVVVDLPLPDRRRRRRRRPAADPGDEALRAEVGALRAQVERLRAELAGRERENMQLRSRLDEQAGDAPQVGAGSSTVEIESPAGERDERTAVELERLAQERDRARAELAAEIERLQGERERLKTNLDELREAFSEAAAEAEATRDRHRAELAAAEERLRAERATVARLTSELAARPELPPPATQSARRAAAAPRTEPASPPAAAADSTRPLPAVDPTQPAPAPDSTQPLPAVVDAASPHAAPGAPGAAAGPAGRESGDDARAAAVPAWLRSDRAAAEAPGRADAGAREAAQAGAVVPARAEPGDRAGEHGPVTGAVASLQALRGRLEHLFVANGRQAAAEPDEDSALPRPLRTASAARARAGATVAARRSHAELWALRVLAALVVAVLLIALLLILTHVA